jgi:hypothetical protein
MPRSWYASRMTRGALARHRHDGGHHRAQCLYGIVDDLAAAGYVVKDKDGRRNRYQIQAHLPLGESIGREPTIGEVLELLVDTNVPQRARGGHR